MKLTVWTYEGPPHVGAMRVVTGMKNVHYVLHAPQGDTYADLLFTMIERRDHRPPVTYTTFQARDLGGDTANIVKTAIADAYERFKPDTLVVGASCTAELIQDDPGGLAERLDLPVPVVSLELPAYQRKENWGAAETFYQMVRTLTLHRAPERGETFEREARADSDGSSRPRVNLLGPTALGFRHRDDITEITRLLERMGVGINVVAPMGATPHDLVRIPDADANVVMYPETAETAVRWLERTFQQPYTKVVPIGIGATRDFVNEVAEMLGIDPEPGLAAIQSNMPWWSKSIDSTYLTGKRVFVFGDASHAVAAARVAAEEMGFEVVGLGTYQREFARDIRKAAKLYDVEPLISDDHLEVEEAIEAAAPELVLGTQMERHIAKRLGVFCAVISAPVHVQDFPARYSPQMGPEGANVLFDTWVHPLVMGLEEHLLGLFQDDFEFTDGVGPSHLHTGTVSHTGTTSHEGQATGEDTLRTPDVPEPVVARASGDIEWLDAAEKELKRIPFFVRGKARRNTEKYALDQGLDAISVDVLYEAKAHFGNR
ncbi:MAG TPA: ferredoxin:protochlorophyllide reductase (ATP-dependent) subunit B [Longimicrobiales bacterium]|nr:ferredoxin:protochlorophyllide reductase (ATP-dependent) subunit B [Longimicrobiales bacterium]